MMKTLKELRMLSLDNIMIHDIDIGIKDIDNILIDIEIGIINIDNILIIKAAVVDHEDNGGDQLLFPSLVPISISLSYHDVITEMCKKNHFWIY